MFAAKLLGLMRDDDDGGGMMMGEWLWSKIFSH
jgi:hypothetical protein